VILSSDVAAYNMHSIEVVTGHKRGQQRMIQLHGIFEDGKLPSLSASLLETFKSQRKRPCVLRIITCYLELDVIEKLVRIILRATVLESVQLIFEYNDIFARGGSPEQIRAKIENLETAFNRKKVALQVIPVRVGQLMHAKAYALIQTTNKRLTNTGTVWITSGNATRLGLALADESRPNIELSYLSKDNADIKEFNSIWKRLVRCKRTIDDDTGSALDEFSFQYALLATGVFLHKWNENLSSRIGVQYRLTRKGKQAATSQTLQALGLSVSQETATSNPLGRKFSDSRAFPRQFAKQYTIETWMEQWCPRSIWRVVEEAVHGSEDFGKFKEDFRVETVDQKLNAAVKREKEREAGLVSNGYVVRDDGRLVRWRKKMEQLREDDTRLKRFYLTFESYDLPYDIQVRKEIETLVESLQESIATRRKSLAARKVVAALGRRDLQELNLTLEEEAKLKQLFA
jgi:hypothetical protein